uniref:Uncharacterized protein n=1 Tax=Rhizophora mucronata TaxID=61149 RepID=A0A2P2PWL4_RHIMU
MSGLSRSFLFQERTLILCFHFFKVIFLVVLARFLRKRKKVKQEKKNSDFRPD